MKRAAIFLVLGFAALWTSCGGGNSNSNNGVTVSNIKDRALFDNTESGGVNILNIDTNPFTIYQTTVASLSAPEQMLIAPDRSFVLIYDDAGYTISIFNSAEETTTGTFNVNYHTESIVMSSDGKFAYAAVPENPETNAPPGTVQTYNLTTGNAGIQIPVPGARRLALSNDNKSLLVFSDNSNTIYYIDLTATTLKPVAIAGFNQPYSAVFSSDNSTAYVFNSGPEFSGSSPATVQAVAISPTAQTLGASVAVPGATVGWLNGTTLYVAGEDLTKPAGSQGVLSTVDTSSLTLTGSVAIADGLHNRMAAFDNKLWIGSWGCTGGRCLSIYDLQANKATIGASTGDVTAMTPAPVKNWMFVMQGGTQGDGQLYEYDPSTLTETAPYTIVGNGWDIKLLDQ